MKYECKKRVLIPMKTAVCFERGLQGQITQTHTNATELVWERQVEKTGVKS